MTSPSVAPLSLLVALFALGCHPAAPSSPGTLETLSPSRGFGFRVPKFSIPPGTERQDCYFFRVPDLAAGQDLWIARFVIAQRIGTHHMNVFRVTTQTALDGAAGDSVSGGECQNSANWSDWPLVVNSQGTAVDWQLPPGVAQRFRPGDKLMLQTHYVNATTQATPDGGEVGVNFYRSGDAAPVELGTLFATQQNIRVCPANPTPSYLGACSIASAQPLHVIAANGHFHSRGIRFRMFDWDGRSTTPPDASEQFYDSTQWDEPVMATHLDVQIPAGGGVQWSCDFQWQPPSTGCDALDARDPQHGDCCYTFGGSVETGEHCNAFVYYWPKSDDVFCS